MMENTSNTETQDNIALFDNGTSLNHANVALCKDNSYSLQWPNNKSEYWKYTKLNAIKKLVLKPSVAATVQSGNAIHFTNGALSQTSAIDNLDVLHGSSLEQSSVFTANFGRLAPWKTDVFAASNLLHASQTVGLIAKKGAQLDNVKIVINSNKDGLYECPRLFIATEVNSSLKIEININGIGAKSLRNLAIEAFVADNSQLEINVIQEEGTEAYTIVQTDVELKNDALAKVNYFNINTHWTRANSNFYIDGKNSDAQVNGIYLPKTEQFIDHHTLVHHALPHCTSHELFRGIIADNSKAVFNGKVLVSKDAQKTDAFQQNNNVILDENSGINAKPELEIYADDVKCSHGCTIGQLDDVAIFYLRARGINIKKARAMVLNAFCEDVLDLISNETLRESVGEKVAQRLAEMH